MVVEEILRGDDACRASSWARLVLNAVGKKSRVPTMHTDLAMTYLSVMRTRAGGCLALIGI